VASPLRPVAGKIAITLMTSHPPAIAPTTVPIVRRLGVAIAAALVVLAGLGAARAPRASRAPESAPTGPGARWPSLARAADGRVGMVWTERGADSVAVVRFAERSPRGAWGPARTVKRDSSLFVNFADHPVLAAHPEGDWIVAWMQRGTGTGKYDYGIRVSRSTDAGAHWSAPAAPHDPVERGEHGFVSLLPLAGGAVGVSFLDGSRNGTPGGATQVAWARLDRGGRITHARPLDTRACDCCQTATAMTSQGPIVVYRDRSDDEVRDIWVTREVGGTWSSPVPLVNEGWKINACPVNGPAIVARGARVAVIWFGAPRDSARVQLAFSADAGATFGSPVRIDAGRPGGHVDVALAEDGGAWASWLERGSGELMEVRVRRVRPDGSMLPPRTIGSALGLRPAGWPVMMAAGDGLLVAWTVPGVPTTVRMERLSVDGR
jgi:hypothetical protein